HWGDTSHGRQLGALQTMAVFPLPPLRDIARRSDVTENLTCFEPGCAYAKNPAIFTVMAAQPELHRERHSRVERLFINIKQVIDVLCVNSVRPTIAELLLTGAPREFKPAFVQEIAKLVRTHHPN